MRARQPMTLLQRAVIQRLREAGFTELSELAHEHWSAGEGIPGGARPGTDAPRHRELLADFDRANAQAERG
jgi:hypothetical protein